MIQIAIHTLPQEIDQLEQSLIRLKYNANHLDYKILVDVVLNLNLVDGIIGAEGKITYRLGEV